MRKDPRLYYHANAHAPLHLSCRNNPSHKATQLPAKSIRSSVVVLRVQNPQDGEEQVNNVEVQRNGRRNLLFDMVVAHDHLRVNQDVAREDQGADNAVAELDLAVVGEERRHEPEQDQYPQATKQVWHPARKVVL